MTSKKRQGVWSTGFEPHEDSQKSVKAFKERKGRRAAIVKALHAQLIEHYVGAETILKAGGYDQAADLIANSMPTKKKIRSGDVAEILATEFLHAETSFRVPVKKLRWKSDRGMPLHGDDLIAVDPSKKRPRLLKGECKSRIGFYPSHAEEAVEQLEKDGCRPNPSSLAFIAKRLYEQDRDSEAHVFRDLQAKEGLRLRQIEHLLFVLSQNNPVAVLADLPDPSKKSVRRRWGAAVVVEQHADLIRDAFETK